MYLKVLILMFGISPVVDLQVPGDHGTLGGDPGEHVTAGSDHAGADSGALSVQDSLAGPVQTVSSSLVTSDW